MDDKERLAYRERDRLAGDLSLGSRIARAEKYPEQSSVVIEVDDLRYLLAERDALLKAEWRIRDMTIESDIMGTVIAEKQQEIDGLRAQIASVRDDILDQRAEREEQS